MPPWLPKWRRPHAELHPTVDALIAGRGPRDPPLPKSRARSLARADVEDRDRLRSRHDDVAQSPHHPRDRAPPSSPSSAPLPIARNSSTRKANRSGMTEHVHQKAQLIVRDTALALRTVAVAQTSQTTGPSIGRGITVVGSAGNGDSSGTRPRKGTEFRRIVPPVRAQPLIAPLRNTHDEKRKWAARSRRVVLVLSRHEISSEAGYCSRKESGSGWVLPSARCRTGGRK
jgi:hypothetical protein